VSVADDETCIVEEGGGAVVGEFGVGEEAQIHALLGDGDGKVCVGGEIFVVAGEGDERRRHVGLGRNESLAKLDRGHREIHTPGIPLQEPLITCNPFVRVWPAQTLMKLLSDLETSEICAQEECTSES